jgi:spheroidene monooxygenase
MPALLHIASFSAVDAVYTVTQMRRMHARLEATPGLAAGRVFATANFWPPTSGYPTLRRYGLLCGFEDDRALAEFDASGTADAFVGRARESWRLRLEPVTVRDGPWRGWYPTTTDAIPLTPDEPMAVMTYGVLRPRHIPSFTPRNRSIIAASMNQEGQVMRVALFDRPLSICTFSIWHSKGAALRFAYGTGLHKAVIRPWRDVPWGVENFFVRFRILDSTGTYAGGNPLAATRIALPRRTA